jgi:hypothetical protein
MRAADLLRMPGSAFRHAARICTTVPVLGIPVRFASDAADVMMHVDTVFGAWRRLAAADIDDRAAVNVRIEVHDGQEAPGALLATEMLDRHRVMIRSTGSTGACDARRGVAVALVSRTLLEDADRFRDGILRALTLALLTRLDRQPLHAAALARRDHGILLCGAAGAGKSTLACAAAAAGMRVLADDIVFLQSRPRPRAWALSSAVHLLPDSIAHFARLPGPVAAVVRGGRRKLAVSLPADHAEPPFLEHCGVCIVGERRAAPSCRRLRPAEALAALDVAAPGFDVFADTVAGAIAPFARAGAWLLHPASSPHRSLPLLEAMLDRVAQPAGMT